MKTFIVRFTQIKPFPAEKWLKKRIQQPLVVHHRNKGCVIVFLDYFSAAQKSNELVSLVHGFFIELITIVVVRAGAKQQQRKQFINPGVEISAMIKVFCIGIKQVEAFFQQLAESRRKQTHRIPQSDCNHYNSRIEVTK